MSLILKKLDYLNILFKTFSNQQLTIVNHNINVTKHLLKQPTDKMKRLMAEQNVMIENLLSDKCLALTRFYLSDEVIQREYFLNREALALFFEALPMAEATIFKQYIERAQMLLSNAHELVLHEFNSELAEPIQEGADWVYLQKQQTFTKKARLGAAFDKHYKAYFYELRQVNENGDMKLFKHKEYHEGFLFYCELLPLMQIKAQQLCQ
ncbi:hypothetical protein E2R68_08990 [Psychromonas sp. RZ22]|uniref:hypothetical protein n=1 Tax=Psychromonas algarum TaxID=2555643 RepID=UPI0010683BAA|nr:hypothetical protein [Psychromonas sp. RZ22]TEW54399.1 hypothetical protein E2R68_08990 [Psychromonas sp. RZ22]